MTDDDRRRFERLALPHLDAAYNLARWLTRDDQDAQDVVQEAVLRALRYFAGFHGEQARPWLLQIVRHTTWSWLERNRPGEVVPFDEALHDDGGPDAASGAWGLAAPPSPEPSAVLARHADRTRLHAALAGLPIVFREALVLRELEDLSYQEIARIAGVPVGTVMSRLSRGRALLRRALSPDARPLLRPVPSPAPTPLTGQGGPR